MKAKSSHPGPMAECLRSARATSLLSLMLLTLPAAVQAQFNYMTNDGTITIAGYTGSGVDVTIPSTINGLPVTRIGSSAFYGRASLTNVLIPNSVTSIGNYAFAYCTGLTSVTIPDSVTSLGEYACYFCSSLATATIGTHVTSIGYGAFIYCSSLTRVTIGTSVTALGTAAFASCTSLTNVTLPNSVASIGEYAFSGCTNLISIAIPSSVTSLGSGAFSFCTNLRGVYFKGNAPSAVSEIFVSTANVTAYYLPGSTGWGTTFAGRPTAFWALPYPLILDFPPAFGVQTNRFGFIISWATNIAVVVEACTDLANPAWHPLQTNTLADGWCYSSDPRWTNYPSRFYRLRSP
jgi:hypothetical protein